jgi:hypothetical protein
MGQDGFGSSAGWKNSEDKTVGICRLYCNTLRCYNRIATMFVSYNEYLSRVYTVLTVATQIAFLQAMANVIVRYRPGLGVEESMLFVFLVMRVLQAFTGLSLLRTGSSGICRSIAGVIFCLSLLVLSHVMAFRASADISVPEANAAEYVFMSNFLIEFGAMDMFVTPLFIILLTKVSTGAKDFFAPIYEI